ncbi:putative polysaccharide biosynthesis protein [Pseudogracilibacillus auburnensis]|uniref:putative polysaccharide biosynthesis protein n=1 Tax=Pseudogracilibacillus auburnensis TaxID=1494959 RepID=UPI001A960044|nr:polysaccharide biosynthesis protein [Pseudogracilibacillus auburnensis]MBO1004451.1 polysaccharide biosynthesis protein [Pseudogracilibacillus auburnensis]
MEINKTKKVVQGAFLLTIAGLLSKIVSATYRIPLQNLTGDFGFYIYQQVYPLIGTVMILSLYGFPIAISKLTTEMKQKNNLLTIRHFYIPLFIILLVINSIFFMIIFFLSPLISTWIGDENLTSTYQLAAFLFLLIPFLALLRGVFQGNEEMHQTAYSQIIEQVIRVSIIITAAYYIFMGKLDIYMIGKAGVMASMLGMGVAIVLCMIFFMLKHKKMIVVPSFQTNIPWKYFIFTCISFGIVGSLNHMILIMIQFVDVFTLVPNLMEYGLSPMEAMEAKGIFDRGQPFIQFGVVFGSSFALAIIPTVVRENIRANMSTIQSVREALLFSFYIAFGATLGLILLLPEANRLLFTNNDGTGSLQILVIAILLSSITITTCAILQSIGYLKQTAIWISVTFLIKWLLNELFVPFWGIYGSAIATVGSLFFLCVASILLLQRKVPAIYFFRHIRWQALFVASGGMFLYIMGVKGLCTFYGELSRVSLLFYVCFVVFSGALLYICLLLRYNVFTEKQLSTLPFSRLFLRLQALFVKGN